MPRAFAILCAISVFPTYNIEPDAYISDHSHLGHKGDDIVEANKKFFNDLDYKDLKVKSDPTFDLQNIVKSSVEAALEHCPFDQNSTTVMDFACNIGLFARGIEPHTKLLVGVDIVQKPVDLLNEYVTEKGISSEKMKAICADLKGVEGELDGLKFDVVTCSAAYHHFKSIDEITKILAFFLKPGGVLLVLGYAPRKDAKPSDDSVFPEGFSRVVAHTNGLTEEAMKRTLEGAGLVSFAFAPIADFNIHGRNATLFIAQAKKSLSV